MSFLTTQTMVPLSRYEAYSLVSMVGDCRVTQVVDVRKGVHRMIPKSVFVKKQAVPGPLALVLVLLAAASSAAEATGRGGRRRSRPRREPRTAAP